MAINEPHPPHGETMGQVDVGYGVRRPVLPAIRWGAVLAGVAVGISIQLALTLLGIATGLSSIDVGAGETLGMGPLIWAGVSMLVAAFFGGYVAARMSGLKRRADGVLHGAVSWAVTTIMFAILATTVGGTLVSGVFSNMSQLARVATANGEAPLTALMRAQGGRVNPQTMSQLQQYLQAGQRDQAIQLVTGTMGVEPTRAETIVDQALIMAGSSAAASPQGKAKVENAMQSAGTAAWIVFLAVTLALAIGIGGGALGAAGSRRISWSDGPVHQS
ncbi:hypothetical protein [Noviherbaspirillum saxi]|uniref:PhnA-like protein n=1 Tax=Noviherbaspirillum saxi TaxID=2320863 RepID=A0A3A3GDW2_9BURK|nr:hypothetical protein [Noviherbaspirillum saxi]RJF99099.1 hypothetical protein D3871_11675 [Noviherbaspirillum saxi]